MSDDIIRSGKVPGSGISRRELAQKLLIGLAAGFLPPALLPPEPIRHDFLDGIWSKSGVGHTAGYKPTFLSAEQMACLDALCDAIIPGSRKAQSPEFIDLLLSVDSDEKRREVTNALAAMDSAASATYRKKIAALNKTEMHQLLERTSAEKAGEQKHFSNLKNWAVAVYYSSEIGMRELGWTPLRVFPTYPGCAHAQEHT